MYSAVHYNSHLTCFQCEITETKLNAAIGLPILARWRRHTFSYASYEVQIKSLNILYKANKRRF